MTAAFRGATWKTNTMHATNTILRLPDVVACTGLRRSAIYAHIARGTFPPPVRLTARAVGWRASDIQAWIDSLPSTHQERR